MFGKPKGVKSEVCRLEWNIHEFSDGTVHLTVKGVGSDKVTPSTNVTIFSPSEWLEFKQEMEMMD